MLATEGIWDFFGDYLGLYFSPNFGAKIEVSIKVERYK